MKKTSVLAWHFLAKNKRLANDDNRLVREGETLELLSPLPVLLCYRGLHASARIIDAVIFAWQQQRCRILCRVRVSGDLKRSVENTKLAGQRRECLWMVDAQPALRLLAIECAERALKREHPAAGSEPSELVNALKIARLRLVTKTSPSGLQAAFDRTKTYYGSSYSLREAVLAAIDTELFIDSLSYSRGHAGHHIDGRAVPNVDYDKDWKQRADAETAWQSRRLRKFIGMLRRGELLPFRKEGA